MNISKETEGIKYKEKAKALIKKIKASINDE